jgi:hypothetical protein
MYSYNSVLLFTWHSHINTPLGTRLIKDFLAFQREYFFPTGTFPQLPRGSVGVRPMHTGLIAAEENFMLKRE